MPSKAPKEAPFECIAQGGELMNTNENTLG